MSSPRSRIICEKIRALRFTEANRKYVRQLWAIERYVLKGGPGSFAESMHYHQLRSTYPVEHGDIFRELDPSGYERSRIESARREREREEIEERFADAKRRERDEDRDMWERLVGDVSPA